MRMRNAVFTGMMGLSLLVVLAMAADFKPYPGAVLDEKATREGNEMAGKANTGMSAAIYTTQDAFAKVAAFYKALGAEYMMPRSSGTAGQPKKSGGYDLWEAYFILDGAKDLATSRAWVKVQRPAIGLYMEEMATMKVRDVTVILLSQKK